MVLRKAQQTMTDYLIPLLLLLASLLAMRKRKSAYDLLLEGSAEGLKLLVTLIPTLILLMTSITMLRSSGAVDYISRICAPVFSFWGIPPETALLVLIRPFSGSAALAVGIELMAAHGADSLIGRTAAIMLGSTETTFYAISVYFGAAGIRKTRYAVPAALIADMTGFIMASLSAKWI
jgi:spore maturation protein B